MSDGVIAESQCVCVCVGLSGQQSAAVRPRGLGPVSVRYAARTVAQRGRTERHGTPGESRALHNHEHHLYKTNHLYNIYTLLFKSLASLRFFMFFKEIKAAII